MTTKKKHVAKKVKDTISTGLGIAALIINVLVIPPGLGSLIGGRITAGLWQIILFIAGSLLIGLGIIFIVSIIGVVIGIPLLVIGGSMLLASWIWALITGIQLVS